MKRAVVILWVLATLFALMFTAYGVWSGRLSWDHGAAIWLLACVGVSFTFGCIVDGLKGKPPA